jgi:hypothetical protein
MREVKDVKYKVYKSQRACHKCDLKDQCTKSQKGRTIHHNVEQDLLAKVDKRTRENRELYAQRQMMVKHPFGTVKRTWGYNYFLTRG